MFTMLKKGTKYIPSHTSEKDSNNINDDNNNADINKIIETKLKNFAAGNVSPNSDYYNDTYKVMRLNCSSYRKAFIVKYIFTYEEDVETDDISRDYKTVSHSAIEEDNWSADSVEQAILYTYRDFGKSYKFRQKYGDKKNLTFHSIYDVYVKLDSSYVPKCYSNTDSTWNNEFRNYYSSENNLENKE